MGLGRIWSDGLTLLWHTGLLYVVAFMVFRGMGKRALGHLAPFDIAVIIMIGEASAIGIEETTKPIWMAIIPVGVLGLLQIFLTWVNMRWRAFESVVQGTDTPLIRDGKVLDKNLWKERVSLADLFTCLREKGIEKLEDVKEARIEPTGHVSVIPKKGVSPLTPTEVGLQKGETLEEILRSEIRSLREEIRSSGKVPSLGRT